MSREKETTMSTPSERFMRTSRKRVAKLLQEAAAIIQADFDAMDQDTYDDEIPQAMVIVQGTCEDLAREVDELEGQ